MPIERFISYRVPHSSRLEPGFPALIVNTSDCRGYELVVSWVASDGDWRDLWPRVALLMRVFPSDHTAPGTRWLPAITSSKARTIQSQSLSVMTNAGSSLMVWLAWPATWQRIFCSLNSGMVMSWQNRPLLAVSSTLHEAFNRNESGGPNSMPIISPLPRT